MHIPTRQYILATLGAIVFLAGPVSVSAAEKLYVKDPATYAKGADVNDKIKAECEVETKVSEHVQNYARSSFEVISSKNLSNAGSAKTLDLTIVNVIGVGGGAWSGAKGIVLRGTLKQGGKVIGTFDAQRRSGGGAFGGYKGTCSIIGRCAKALGKDIYDWLQQPSMNAKLGELK